MSQIEMSGRISEEQFKKGMDKWCGDAVNHPVHYNSYPIEVIDMIERVLTPEQFQGYCLGNSMKYRMRAGLKDKDKTQQDIDKAEWYRERMMNAS